MLRHALATIALVCCLLSQAYAEEHLEFIPLNAFNSKTNSKWGPVLKDIMNHEAPGDSNPFNDLVTLGHETSHGIHAYIRNTMNHTGKKANGFYVLQNRAVVLVEPNMRKSDVAEFIPAPLRGYRYSTYITGQTEWDDTPLYIFDEWNAYVNGGDVAVDLVEKGLWTYEWQDAVSGQLEFVVYALATAMAAEKKDAVYFQSYAPFKEFIAFNTRRSMDGFRKGSVMDSFKWETQDKYYTSLKTHPDAENLRDFTRKVFGTAWTSEVLGF